MTQATAPGTCDFLQHSLDYKHQAEYTSNVPDCTTLHVQISAPDQMFTLSMLKHGSRNNCTTMHVNHTEDLKHDCVRVLPLHKKLTTSKTWTVAYANGNTTAEFIHFHLIWPLQAVF